jgi:hypothetical protein
MNKIRLIEGYHPRKNIEYYRDYEIKTHDFLNNENLSNIEKIKPYFLNNSEKFKYDYFKAVFYDKDNDEYDYIYFCIHQEIYTITTENDIYIFYRDDTVNVLYNKEYKEMYITDISIGNYIDVFFDNDNYELVTDISIDY